MSARPLPRSLAKHAMVLPVLLAAALLIVAFKLGRDGRQVLGAVRAIPPHVLVTALAMAAVYLLLKAWQLHLLLANLGLRPGARRLALAFAAGELLVTLPLGIFAQNWVLSSTGRARFATSSTATILMLVVEALVTLLCIAALGVPHWPEARPAAVLLSVGIVLAGFAALRFEHPARVVASRARLPLLRDALAGILGLLEGLRRLSSLRILSFNFVLAALYLGALAVAFRAVGGGIGLERFGFSTAAAIYAVSLAAVLVCGGLVSHVGTVEVLGMEAAHAWGISLSDGFALMISFRLVWTGAIWLLSLPLVLLSWRKTFAAREGAPASAHDLEESPH